MVSRGKLFVIFGSNFLQRRQAETSIRRGITVKQSASLETTVLYGKETGIRELRGRVVESSFSRQRLFIFKDFLRLGPDSRNFLAENIDRITRRDFIIFETDRSITRVQKERRLFSDRLVKLVFKSAIRFCLSQRGEQDWAGDFMNALRRNDLKECLFILEGAFQGNPKSRIGPQILGILISWCSYLPDRISSVRHVAGKKECLRYLWEADRAIKEKGIDGRLVIDVLLTKIFRGRLT